MKKILSSLIVLFCFGIFVVGVYGDDEKAKEIDLKDVPAKIIEAVKGKGNRN